MTFLELQNYMAQELDDLNFGYFTQPQVQSWLNRAQLEVQRLLIQAFENYYTICSQTMLIQGQPDYFLPENFLKVDLLEYVVSGNYPNQNMNQIIPITTAQQYMLPTGNAPPAGYYLTKNKFICVPPPDNNYICKILYTYRIADMVNDNDQPDMPEQYHEFIAIVALLNGFIKDDRNPVNLLKKYDTYLDSIKKDAENRRVDAPRRVVTTYDSYYSGY